MNNSTMINKLIALTLLVFSSILSFGQTEKVISVRGGNGTLYEAKGLVDDSGYSVLIFQFVPKSSILFFWIRIKMKYRDMKLVPLN